MVPVAASGSAGATAPLHVHNAPMLGGQMSAMGLMTQLATLLGQQMTQPGECPGLQIFGNGGRAQRPHPVADAGADAATDAPATTPTPPPQTQPTAKGNGKGDADGDHLMERLERAAAGDNGYDLPQDDLTDVDDTAHGKGKGKGKTVRGSGRGTGAKGAGKKGAKGKAKGKGKTGTGKGKGNANNGVMRRPAAVAMRRPAAAGLGCSKCRYLPRGCGACR